MMSFENQTLSHTEFFNVNEVEEYDDYILFDCFLSSLFNRLTSEMKDPLQICCLALRNFSKAIDLTLLPSGTDCSGSSNINVFELQMKETKQEKYQVSFINLIRDCKLSFHLVLYLKKGNDENFLTGEVKVCLSWTAAFILETDLLHL